MLLQDPTTTTTTTDAERVRAAIARLSPAERDALVLRFRDGLSTAELAAATGTSTETVERRLRHAAWVVEDVVGVLGPDGVAPAGAGTARPTAFAVEEAALGITPLLATRLAAAVAGPVPPAADDRWWWHALVEVLRRRGDGVATTLLAVVAAVPTALSLMG